MELRYDILSIGALSKNPFWNEHQAVRTAHATSTLIRAGDTNIVVDPGLPGMVLNALLGERAGLKPDDIHIVFLTSFRQAHRMGLGVFKKAKWLMHEAEIDYWRGRLQGELDNARRNKTAEATAITEQLTYLKRIEPVEDRLADGVDSFFSPGSTAGNCGLLLTEPVGTIVIAGDAVVNRDYLQCGRVHEACFDAKRARESMQDILEVADIVIPGHDNLIPLMGKFAYRVSP